MPNGITTDKNNEHVLNDRKYKIGGNPFVFAHSVSSYLSQGQFYQRYSVALSNEPHLAFIRLLRDVDPKDKEDSCVDDHSYNGQTPDGPAIQDNIMLEGYFNDLYKLFLRKLATFDCQVAVIEEDKNKLRTLLEEIIKVKTMLCTGSSRV